MKLIATALITLALIGCTPEYRVMQEKVSACKGTTDELACTARAKAEFKLAPYVAECEAMGVTKDSPFFQSCLMDAQEAAIARSQAAAASWGRALNNYNQVQQMFAPRYQQPRNISCYTSGPFTDCTY